jgi:rhodanese-related sulfurtransferase
MSKLSQRVSERKKATPKSAARPAPAAKAPARAARKTPWLWIGTALAAVLLNAVFLLMPKSAAPAEITVQQAYEKYNDGVFLLDVRTQEEWDTIHIPNTTLIPLDQLSSRVAELPADQEIVVVCRSGNRSQQGRDILKAAGFENVTSMTGGVNQWSTAGYPTE